MQAAELMEYAGSGSAWKDIWMCVFVWITIHINSCPQKLKGYRSLEEQIWKNILCLISIIL